MEVIRTSTVTNNHWEIRPGPVGSVGDANMQIRYAQNMPDSDMLFSQTFGGSNLKYLGSNVQDGSFGSGGSARTIIRKFGIRPGQKTAVGWMKQDLIPTDRTTDPLSAPLGPYTWNNKRAQVFRAKISGQAFLPSPGGYDKSLLQGRNARGNQHPRIVLTEAGSAPTPQSLNYISEANNLARQGGVVEPMSAGTTPLGAPQIAARRGMPGLNINTKGLF